MSLQPHPPLQCSQQGMIVRSCVWQRTAPICPSSATAIGRSFHASAGRKDESGMPNHYETLDIATNATAGEIKKQFYKLSKAYHPDLHPDNPDASQRFVKISEAYATLGSPEKRQRYDRDFMRASQPAGGMGGGQAPTGSYSSAATGPGGRPASGLSRRRTQFRGPPPSFYRSGGWGEHSAKRGEHANKASHTNETSGDSASGPAGPGMGPGGFSMGFDNDVPHFDNQGHLHTHSELAKNRHRGRRREAVQYAEAEMSGSGGSVLFNFVMISGIVGVVMAFTSVVYRTTG